jgi:hypothetical protein
MFAGLPAPNGSIRFAKGAMPKEIAEMWVDKMPEFIY